MKLERLNLKAFGFFEEHTLDLAGGNYGLHLIYGPNEAGKSTTLRAISQLFYGIPMRTGDDFRHTMQSLRIGATISNEKGALAFVRRKGNKATIRKEDDKTELDDDVLLPYLGGVDAETFSHLFGLSHEQLVAGGEALVKGEGDVGQALFSAAAGLGSLRAVLDGLDGAAGDLFKVTGTKPLINGALREYKDLCKAMKDAQIMPKEWVAISEELVEKRRERDDLVLRIQTHVAEQSRLERIVKALPLVGTRIEMLGRLAALHDPVVLPEDFRERRVAAVQALSMATEQHQIAEASLSRINVQLGELEVDEALLAQEQRIESLHGRHEVNRKAIEDKQQKLDAQHRQYESDVTRLLRDLHGDRNAIEELRPAPGLARRISELASERQSIEKDDAHARAQIQKLALETKRYEDGLASLGDLTDTAGLARAIQRVRPIAGLESEFRDRAAAASLLSSKIEAAIARLSGWSGSPSDLEALSVPLERSIEGMRIQMESDTAELQRCDNELRAVEKEQSECTIQLETLQRAQHVPTEAELLALRRQRELGWGHARTAWEAGTPPTAISAGAAVDFLATLPEGPENLADAVESLTHKADETADRLRRESDRAATVAQWESRRDGAIKKSNELAEAREMAVAQQIKTRDTWNALWEPLGLEARSPMEMVEWRGDYKAILEDIQRLKAEEHALQAQNERAEQVRSALLDALSALGEAADTESNLSDLLVDSEATLERFQERRQQQEQWSSQLADAEQSLAELEQGVERIAADEARWSAEWADKMASIGARADASTAEALAKLDLLESLFDTMDKCADLEGRIAQIDADNEDYLNEVEALAEAASADVVEQPREGLIPALFQALKVHRQRATERASLVKQQAEQEETLMTSEAALARAENELAALFSLAKVESVSELEAAESISRQYEAVRKEIASLEARLLDFSPGLGLNDFLAMVATEDSATLEARLQALAPEREEAEHGWQALSEVIGKLEDKLNKMDGSDTAATLAGEGERILATMAEDVREYARLKVAHFVLNESIERFREANQEPLLARASAIFSALTLGSFQALRAEYDSKGNHVLSGFRPGSEVPVHVPGMSEGTADQLYLALRIASLERHLESHAPIPFVLDDILVNFDDARAAATLTLLGELSERTQVIYFTHHRHLVELAKAHVDKKYLFTHTLGA